MKIKKLIKKYGFSAMLVAIIWPSLYELIKLASPVSIDNDSLSVIALSSFTFIYSVVISLYLNRANNIGKED